MSTNPTTKPDSSGASTGSQLWNCWSNNYMQKHGGYFIHAGYGGDKAVCGVRVQQYGGVEVPEETEPGCLRCRAILRKQGILTENSSIEPTKGSDNTP